MALRYDSSSQFLELLISNYNPMEGAGMLKQLNLFEMEGDEETDE